MGASILGRLAPSPTGALHLGNARTFLLAWLDIRSRGGRLVMRMEDLDGPRVKRGAAAQALDDLTWLGLDWDGPVVLQSSRRERHDRLLADLLDRGAAFPCTCSRSEVARAASAPHDRPGQEGPAYPGTCRGRWSDVAAARQESGRPAAVRMLVAGEARVEFTDRFRGEQRFAVGREVGDFVVAKGDGTPAYQLACVVDDHEMGITDVLRGDDLLSSTARQLLIYRACGWEAPRFVHTPLLVGTDGRRLAKRHGDTRISRFREAGLEPARLVGWLGAISGLLPPGREAMPADLLGGYALDLVPPAAVTVTLPLPGIPEIGP